MHSDDLLCFHIPLSSILSSSLQRLLDRPLCLLASHASWPRKVLEGDTPGEPWDLVALQDKIRHIYHQSLLTQTHPQVFNEHMEGQAVFSGFLCGLAVFPTGQRAQHIQHFKIDTPTQMGPDRHTAALTLLISTQTLWELILLWTQSAHFCLWYLNSKSCYLIIKW